MKLTVQGINGIEGTFELSNLNVFKGLNGSGKSTCMQIIKDLLQGKTNLKKGEATLELEGKTIIFNNGAIFNSPGAKINELGFLTGKGKQVKGYNSTKQDRRNTVFELLNIKPMEGDISGLTGELKTLKTKESVLMDELMELESKEIESIEEPKEVKLINGSEGNKQELDNLNLRLQDIQIENLLEVPAEPKKIELRATQTIKGNNDSLQSLKNELEAIKVKGQSIKDMCPTCGHKLEGSEVKDKLREEYQLKEKEIQEFTLIEDKIVEGNEIEYNKYRDELEKYNRIVDTNSRIKESNLNKNTSIQSIKREIEAFKLVEGTKGNQEEYETYQLELSKYNTYKSNIKTKEESIKLLREKIKDIPTIEIENKIKQYRKDELEFNKELEDKLTLGDIKIITMRQLASPNTAGEMFANDFNIEYKGKSYDECSSGIQIMIDVKVNQILFPESEYIIIDSAEISDENLQLSISDLKDKIVFTTRISKEELICTNSL